MKALDQQIIERLEADALEDDVKILTLTADILSICASCPNIRIGALAHLSRRIRALPSFSKEGQSVSQQLSDFSERLELVEAHLDELNDLLITAGIQDVQSSS